MYPVACCCHYLLSKTRERKNIAIGTWVFSCRTSSGLPRVGQEHAGLRHLIPLLVTLGILAIAEVPYAIFIDSFWQGRIGIFPWCLTLSLMQLLPAFCLLVFAPTFIMRSEPNFKRVVLRGFKEFF